MNKRSQRQEVAAFNISLDENLLRNAADLSPFLQKFREDNCVFVDYSAKLVAW